MIASRHVRAVSVSKLGFSRGTNSSFRSKVYWRESSASRRSTRTEDYGLIDDCETATRVENGLGSHPRNLA
jgi:hypothetical protein